MLDLTHHEVVRNAASVHFRPSVTRTEHSRCGALTRPIINYCRPTSVPSPKSRTKMVRKPKIHNKVMFVMSTTLNLDEVKRSGSQAQGIFQDFEYGGCEPAFGGPPFPLSPPLTSPPLFLRPISPSPSLRSRPFNTVRGYGGAL